MRTVIPDQPAALQDEPPPVAKLAYYRDRGLVPGLARRYFREFNGARRILDVGCGTGDFGRYKPSSEIEIHGIDIDAQAVQAAQQFEVAICLDLESAPLPYANESFDAALAKDIFEHLQDPARLAREVWRVLRPGGVLVASVVMDRPSRVWADYTHVRGFTQRSAQMLLEDAGFTVEAMWRMGGVPLTNRLNLIGIVPYLLRIPVFDQLWGSSWEIRARRH